MLYEVITDLAKSTLLASVLMAAVVAGALALVQHSPRFWWLWVWAFFALVTLFLLYLSPYVIEPLFFKFSPVARPELAAAIETLMARAGLRVRITSYNVCYTKLLRYQQTTPNFRFEQTQKRALNTKELRK